MKKNDQLLKIDSLNLTRLVKVFAVHVFCGLLAVLLMLTSAAAQTTFAYTGAIQTYAVPTGAIGVLISATGAGGGGAGWDANGNGGNGGSGALASGTYLVSPGTVLSVAVGGGGQGGKSQSTFFAADLGGDAAGGFAGGNGGSAGGQGYSGNGAGGGAASGVLGVLIAGGGGGGQGGAWNTLGRFGDSSTATGAFPAANGAAGASPGNAADGGGGGGGGGGCPAGAGGPLLNDNSGSGTQGGFAGASCRIASVTGFTAGAGGGAGGIGRLASETNVPGTAGGNGSVTVTPIFPAASLIITKTDNKAVTATGGTNNYVVTLTNLGPSPANGVVLSDTPGAGLICPPANPVTCAVTGAGAVCPTGPLTFANLSAGVTVATLPANGALTFSYTCNVN
jgi:uncharacterized repeat protein (TIGR01451 family)